MDSKEPHCDTSLGVTVTSQFYASITKMSNWCGVQVDTFALHCDTALNVTVTSRFCAGDGQLGVL